VPGQHRAPGRTVTPRRRLQPAGALTWSSGPATSIVPRSLRIMRANLARRR
jgi:hypothetical protein